MVILVFETKYMYWEISVFQPFFFSKLSSFLWLPVRFSWINKAFLHIPYFFGYKTEFFSFQNNPKDLDPSCKIGLDLLGLFRKGKIGIIAKLHRTYIVI